MSGPFQARMGNCVEATNHVEARRELMGERLVVNEAVGTRRRNGALVQIHGIQRASLDPGNLGADQGSAILEVVGTVRRPRPKLLFMLAQGFSMCGIRVGP